MNSPMGTKDSEELSASKFRVVKEKLKVCFALNRVCSQRVLCLYII